MAVQSIADPTHAGHHGSEAQIDAVNVWMRSTPWYQAQLAQWGQNPQSVKLSKAQSAQLMDLARAHGVDITKDTEVDPAGNLNPKGHKLRNTIIVAGIAGAALGGAAALGAFSGAGGAAGGAAAALGPSTAANIAATSAAASAVPAGLSAGTAAAGGGGLFGGLLTAAGGKAGLVNAGVNLASNAIASRQVSKATNAQLAATDKALALQGDIYQQQRADQAPWLQAGQGASAKLSYLLGIPMPQNAAQGTAASAGAPVGAPVGSRTAPANSTLLGTAVPRSSQTVTVQAPTGETQQVPAYQAEHYIQRGAKILDAVHL